MKFSSRVLKTRNIIFIFSLVAALTFLYVHLLKTELKIALKGVTLFDEYCEKYGEWEGIDRKIFIKRTAVFYFIDEDLLRFFIIKRHNCKYKISIEIIAFEIDENLQYKEIINFHIHSDLIMIHSLQNKDDYNKAIVDVRLNISRRFSFKTINWKNIILRIKVKDLISNFLTVNFLEANIKYLRNSNSEQRKNNSSLLCSKCFYLKQKDDFESLRMWIELNRLIGYEKISLCDHDIEKNEDFANLFKRNKDFLTVYELQCIPNLKLLKNKSNQKYFYNYRNMPIGPIASYPW
jgi:hypothetical protein